MRSLKNKLSFLCIFLFLILSSEKASAAIETWLNTFNSYTPASQNGTCASITGIGAVWNNGSVNCAGGSSGTAVYNVVWYYNTTNSTSVATATYVYTNTSVS